MPADFPRTGLLSTGYDPGEVGLFFLQAEVSLARGDGAVTRVDVEQMRFSTRRRGYRTDEVDAAMQELAARLTSSAGGAAAGSASESAAESPVDDSALEDAVAEITTARFETTTFAAGYDMSEVDDLLDLAVATLHGAGSLTADDLLEVRFTTTRFREGYDMELVDAFLDEQVGEALRRFGPQL